jgi:sugar O-acyltransferase (sialic acid O-acetyltransferase NeuD family)
MTKLVIFGAGKIAEVVQALLSDDPDYSVAGFTCDREFMIGSEKQGLPVVPFEEVESVFPPGSFAMLVAIGYQDVNTVRAARCEQARAKGYRLISWVSPRAHVPKGCVIGANCIVMDGASLQPQARLGDDVFVWNGAVVGHHATIGDHCWLASNCTISSTVVAEPFCFFGVNAAIGHGITIGARNIIGATTVITRSTEPDGVYITPDTVRFRLDSRRFLKISRISQS